MIFHYSSIDLQGKKQRGLIEALSLGEAKEKLRARGIVIISIVSKKTRFKQCRLKGNALVTFTTQLSDLLAAGIPLYESLVSLEEQYRQEAYHPILLSLCEQIHEGSSLSKAMGAFPDSFDRAACAMVAAGESVGALEITLAKLGELLAKQIKLRKQIVTALLYPALLGGFSLCIVFLLMTFVIPSLEMLFEGRTVGRLTQTVIGISHFLTQQWMIYLPLLTLGVLGIWRLFKNKQTRLWLQRQQLRIPVVGTLLIQTALTRFSQTMGTLLDGGVTMIEALRIARQVMRSPSLERVIERAEEKIVEGSALSYELKQSPLIPPLVPRMLAVGEESGNVAAMLGKVADFYDGEVEKSLTRLTNLAQPVILLIMGAIVGVIMMAVLLPLTDIHAFLEV